MPKSIDPKEWSLMTPEGCVQAIVGVLLALAVYLVCSLIKGNKDILKAMKEQGEKDRTLLKEQGEKDRTLIREECRLVREDHNNDIRALFDAGREDRQAVQAGFRELTAAINQLKKRNGL